MHELVRFERPQYPPEKLIVSEVNLCQRTHDAGDGGVSISAEMFSQNRKHLSFETALGHVNCARSPVWNSWRAAEDPRGPAFLSRLSFHVHSLARSLGSFALCAPVRLRSWKSMLRSECCRARRECLGRLSRRPPPRVLPVIPNFLRGHTRFPLLEDDAPESSGLARHYSRANTLDWTHDLR